MTENMNNLTWNEDLDDLMENMPEETEEEMEENPGFEFANPDRINRRSIFNIAAIPVVGPNTLEYQFRDLVTYRKNPKRKGKKVGVAHRSFFHSVKAHIPSAELIMDYDANNIKKYDLIIFTGGEDVSPTYYSEDNQYCHGVNSNRDQIEFHILRAAQLFNKHIVGFCRGLQLINVGFGGSLYQDYNIAGFKYHPGDHPLENVVSGSVIKQFFGDHTVVSAHHQGIKMLGENLNPSSSYKGIIESIETDHVIATQFHPEFESSSEEHVKNFFKFLVEEW